MNPKSLPTPDTYPLLLKCVRETLIDGQRRIDAQRVRTYWETGRVIQADILKNADRAEYGTRVIKRLAKDLNIDSTNLRRCVQFAKVYPDMPIVDGRQQFTWTHFRKLIAIDKKEIHWIIETKGMESEETQFKDRAATIWCENASSLTDKKWRYKKVSQQKFKELQPTNLADLEVI